MPTLAPRTFRLRIFWSVVPVVAVFLIFQAVMSGRAHWQLVTDEFDKRGLTIAGQLASSVELGVYSEDKQLLGASIRGALKDPDVAYVVIYGEGGRVLAEGGRLSKDVPITEAAVTDVTSSRRAARGGERFIEFRAPVTVEETRTAEEELVRQGAGSEGGATKTIGGLRVGLSLRGVEEKLWGLLKLWAGTTVAFVVLSALALSTFSRRITRPINRLTEQAGKVAAGRLEETISVGSRDEIGQLAVAFNEMTRSLKLSTGEKEQALTDLRDLNRTLEERIERRTAELRDRGRDLQRSLEEVRAMGEISQAVASTLDVTAVLNTISARAVGLSRSDVCAIFERDPLQGRLAGVAFYNAADDFVKALQTGASVRGEQSLLPIGQAMETGQAVQVPEIPAERPATPFEQLHARAGFRALLAVPMAGGDVARAMVVYRRAAGPFDDRAVALLTTLAHQSKIALDNARLFKELADKSRQLEVASRHKSDFLASVSHELRTPLNAILGFNELILGEVYGEVPSDLRVPLTDVQNSGRHLLGLINNVLDLSKIEAGRMELALSDYLVSDVVESVSNALRSLATAKGLELDTTVAAGIPLAHGDPGRITQCLMNLTGNALKFTPRGRILIAVERAGDLLHFRVADTGIGIAPDRLATVFDEFRQADVTIAREFGGTGLGLSITRKFVEMHGGRVWADSTLGKGSTFWFAIPLRVEAGRTS